MISIEEIEEVVEADLLTGSSEKVVKEGDVMKADTQKEQMPVDVQVGMNCRPLEKLKEIISTLRLSLVHIKRLLREVDERDVL